MINKTTICILLSCFVQMASQLVAQTPLNDLGQFYPEIQEYANNRSMSYSWLSKDWPELEQWRIQGRAKMMELLSFSPAPVPLNPEITEKVKKEGYTRYKVRYSVTPHRKTEAYLLIPDGLTKPAAAVIALHDHGGFYYYGKEKITETEDQPKILRNFINEAYGGRPYADELARRGFVVLCPDAFYFGSQRIDINLIGDYFLRDYPDINSSDKEKAIEAYNQFCSKYENIMARYIFDAGTTWPGILFHGDSVSDDYL